MGQRVALFGGSFNPIHIGHLITARTIAESLGCSRLFFIPCARPPHKWPHELAGTVHRIEMLRRAIVDEPLLAISDVECHDDHLHYPIHAIETFRRELGSQVELAWIIGSDAVPELRQWHRLADMLELCEIVVACRGGYEFPDLSFLEPVLAPAQMNRLRASRVATPHIDISATQIRQRIRERRPIRYWVPESVCDYIEEVGLYLSSLSHERSHTA